jgi:hypothetical protein
MSLVGKSFRYYFKGECINFTITRERTGSVRVKINNSKQAIWLPSLCLSIKDSGEVTASYIAWKLRRSEFRHKLELSKQEQAI